MIDAPRLINTSIAKSILKDGFKGAVQGIVSSLNAPGPGGISPPAPAAIPNINVADPGATRSENPDEPKPEQGQLFLDRTPSVATRIDSDNLVKSLEKIHSSIIDYLGVIEKNTQATFNYLGKQITDVADSVDKIDAKIIKIDKKHTESIERINREIRALKNPRLETKNLIPDRRADAQRDSETKQDASRIDPIKAVEDYLLGKGLVKLGSALLGSTAVWGAAGGIAIIEIARLLREKGYISKWTGGRAVGPYDTEEEQRKAKEEAHPGIDDTSWRRRRQLREIENYQRRQRGEPPLPELPERHRRHLDRRNRPAERGQETFGGGKRSSDDRNFNQQQSPSPTGQSHGPAAMTPLLKMFEQYMHGRGSTSAPGGGSFAQRPPAERVESTFSQRPPIGGGSNLMTMPGGGLGIDNFGPPAMPGRMSLSGHDLIAAMRAITAGQSTFGGGRGGGGGGGGADAASAGQATFGGGGRGTGGSGGTGTGTGTTSTPSAEDVQRISDFRAFMSPTAMGPAQRFEQGKTSFGPSTTSIAATPLGKVSMLAKDAAIGLIQPNVKDGSTGAGYDGKGYGPAIGPERKDDKSLQASIRYNNPGAAWPRAEDTKFGGDPSKTGVIGGNNKIGWFPTPVHGAAANMNLLATSKNYIGQTIGKAIDTWSGHSRHSVPGFDSNQVITKEMVEDPKFMIAFFQQMRKAEAGKGNEVTDAQLKQAFDMYRAGSTKAYEDKGTDKKDAPPNGAKSTKGTQDLPPGVTSPNWKPELSGGKVDLSKATANMSPEAQKAMAGVPAEALAKAAAMIKNNPQGQNITQEVVDFMKSQGITPHLTGPDGPVWCGDFVAAVIKSEGGEPPKDYAAAAAWHKYGEQIDKPGAGDVALMPGAARGHAYHHVAVISEFDPKTGVYTISNPNPQKEIKGTLEQLQKMGFTEFRHKDIPVTPGNPEDDKKMTPDAKKEPSGEPAKDPGYHFDPKGPAQLQESIKDGKFQHGPGIVSTMGGEQGRALVDAMRQSLTPEHYREWEQTGILDPSKMTDAEYNKLNKVNSNIAALVQRNAAVAAAIPTATTGTATPAATPVTDKATPPGGWERDYLPGQKPPVTDTSMLAIQRNKDNKDKGDKGPTGDIGKLPAPTMWDKFKADHTPSVGQQLGQAGQDIQKGLQSIRGQRQAGRGGATTMSEFGQPAWSESGLQWLYRKAKEGGAAVGGAAGAAGAAVKHAFTRYEGEPNFAGGKGFGGGSTSTAVHTEGPQVAGPRQYQHGNARTPGDRAPGITPPSPGKATAQVAPAVIPGTEHAAAGDAAAKAGGFKTERRSAAPDSKVWGDKPPTAPGLHTQTKPTTSAVPHFKEHQAFEKARGREHAGAPPDTGKGSGKGRIASPSHNDPGKDGSPGTGPAVDQTQSTPGNQGTGNQRSPDSVGLCAV